MQTIEVTYTAQGQRRGYRHALDQGMLMMTPKENLAGALSKELPHRIVT
jgi:hypothetical protein